MLPIVHNSNESTIINNRQGVGPTNRNNIQHPTIKFKINQRCCKSVNKQDLNHMYQGKNEEMADQWKSG